MLTWDLSWVFWVIVGSRGGEWRTMLLTGTFLRSLDDKLRFSIPKPLRESLGRPNNAVMYMAPGTDGSLALYAEEVFAGLASQLAKGSPAARDVRAFSRLFYAQAQPVETDRQGRVRIPPQLAELASLSGEIVLLGVRDHLEIWDRRLWADYLAAKLPSYDQIAESAPCRAGSWIVGGGRPRLDQSRDGGKQRARAAPIADQRAHTEVELFRFWIIPRCSRLVGRKPREQPQQENVRPLVRHARKRNDQSAATD